MLPIQNWGDLAEFVVRKCHRAFLISLTVWQMVMIDVIGFGGSAHYAPTVCSDLNLTIFAEVALLLLRFIQSTQQEGLKKADGIISAGLLSFRAGNG